MSDLTGTSSSDNLNGGSGNDTLSGGAGNDTLSGGSGSDILDGGSGSDRLNGGSGTDTLIYRLAENSGSTDLYTGGSGWDTVRIMLTEPEWLGNSTVQAELTRYVTHLETVKRNAQSGEVSNGSASDFTFDFGNGTKLTVSMMEQLQVYVGGQLIALDQPVVDGGTFSGAVREDGNSDNDSATSQTASGSITFFDLDVTDTHSVAVAAPAGAIGTLSASISNAAQGDGQGAVTWTYVLDNAAAQSLALGESKVEVFNLVITDDEGHAATRAVTINITGTNDAPTVVAALSAAAAEDDAGFTLDLLTGAADVDHDAMLSVTNVSGLVAGVTVSGSTLSVDPSDATFQSLKLGEPMVIVVSYDVSDEHGATVPQTATITITGTNDTPTVAAALSAAAAEDDEGFTLDLLTGAADVDHDATLSVSNVAGLVAGVTVTGSTLNVDPTDAAFQSLKLGEPMVIVVSYDVSDQHGATAPQTATITITGTNDAPTVAAALNAAANEDSAGFTLDLLTGAADVDHDAVLSVTNVSGLVAGVTVTGSTLNVDPSNAAFQSLALGEPMTIVVSYDVSDQHGATVPQTATITITGTNDAPMITTNGGAPLAVAVAENTTAAADIDATDVDSASLTYSITGGADALKFAINPTTGALTFVAAPNYEVPTDAGLNNVYDVTVAVSDGVDADTQAIAVQVNDVFEGVAAIDLRLIVDAVPGGNGLPTGAFAHVVPTDPDGGATQTYTLSGSSAFSISSTGVLSATGVTQNATYSFAITAAQTGQDPYAETFYVTTGSNAVNNLIGSGDDVIYAQQGSDIVLAGSGDDTVFGQADVDNISGGDGADRLYGNAGNDTLDGGSGDDLLDGGAGVSTLTGGAGADTFVFNGGTGDTSAVSDFAADGIDLIALSGFANIANASGRLSSADFAGVATGGATAVVGSGVNIIYDAGTGNLYFDSNGGTSGARSLIGSLTIADGGTFDFNDMVVGVPPAP